MENFQRLKTGDGTVLSEKFYVREQKEIGATNAHCGSRILPGEDEVMEKFRDVTWEKIKCQ